MAKPPRYKEVIFEVPGDGFEWFKRGLAQLTSFMTDTASALDRGISGENLRRQEKVLDVDTGASVDASFPISFNVTMGAVPKEVRVGQVRVVTPGGSVASAPGIWWELTSGSVVKVNKIFGLNPSTRYQITLLVE